MGTAFNKGHRFLVLNQYEGTAARLLRTERPIGFKTPEDLAHELCAAEKEERRGLDVCVLSAILTPDSTPFYSREILSTVFPRTLAHADAKMPREGVTQEKILSNLAHADAKLYTEVYQTPNAEECRQTAAKIKKTCIQGLETREMIAILSDPTARKLITEELGIRSKDDAAKIFNSYDWKEASLDMRFGFTYSVQELVAAVSARFKD